MLITRKFRVFPKCESRQYRRHRGRCIHNTFNMAAPLRSEVLSCFRRLHRTRTRVFQDDAAALEAARTKINSEFRKYLKISSPQTITELVKLGNQAEEILRTSVIQARPVDEGKLRLRLTEDTAMFSNTPYRDVPDEILKKKRSSRPKCS